MRQLTLFHMQNIHFWICLHATIDCAIARSPFHRHVLLRIAFVEHEIRCISGVKSSSTQPSVSKCVMQGMTTNNCHAVNYDMIAKTCQLIISHGSRLTFENAVNHTFIALKNTKELIETGTDNTCGVESVQWEEQYRRAFVAPINPVYLDNSNRERYVCKVRVGDNELPGVVSVTEKKCKFVSYEQVSAAEFFTELVISSTADVSVHWLPYTVGDSVPNEAFVGGQTSEGIALFVCRAAISGIFYSGYYDPSTGQVSIHAGSLQRPTQVELLAFLPDGPTSAAPIKKLTMPTALRTSNLFSNEVGETLRKRPWTIGCHRLWDCGSSCDQLSCNEHSRQISNPK